MMLHAHNPHLARGYYIFGPLCLDINGLLGLSALNWRVWKFFGGSQTQYQSWGPPIQTSNKKILCLQ